MARRWRSSATAPGGACSISRRAGSGAAGWSARQAVQSRMHRHTYMYLLYPSATGGIRLHVSSRPWVVSGGWNTADGLRSGARSPRTYRYRYRYVHVREILKRASKRWKVHLKRTFHHHSAGRDSKVGGGSEHGGGGPARDAGPGGGGGRGGAGEPRPHGRHGRRQPPLSVCGVRGAGAASRR